MEHWMRAVALVAAAVGGWMGRDPASRERGGPVGDSSATDPAALASLKVPIPIRNRGAESGALDGWDFDPSGWAIHSPGHSGQRSFRVTHTDVPVHRSQRIDLVAAGFSAAELDRGPTLEASAFLLGNPLLTGNLYELSVTFEDATGNVLDSGSVTRGPQIGLFWQRVQLERPVPPGTRVLVLAERAHTSFILLIDDARASMAPCRRR